MRVQFEQQTFAENRATKEKNQKKNKKGKQFLKEQKSS